MFLDKRLLAVVPAREAGETKGIKLKNLRIVGGVPLVARVGHVVAECNFIDRAVVSTDHPEIARVCRSRHNFPCRLCALTHCRAIRIGELGCAGARAECNGGVGRHALRYRGHVATDFSQPDASACLRYRDPVGGGRL